MIELTSPPPLYGSKLARNTDNAAQTPVPAAPEVKDDAAVLSSDFETFLKMLTVQVQNQDPLNPVDSTEYATQLATFSSVEQQVLTNDLLKEMKGLLGGGSEALQRLSSWIGMEGSFRAPVRFSGQPLTVQTDVHPEADSAVMVVTDSSGPGVDRVTLAKDQTSVTWKGKDSSNITLPSDSYKFEVVSYDDLTGNVLQSTTAQFQRQIVEVQTDGGVTRLEMSDGTQLSEADITGLRQASL